MVSGQCQWMQPTNPQTKNLICVYQELGAERPTDLYNRFQGELLFHKSLPQRFWCFFLSVSSYIYKLAPNVINAPVSKRFSQHRLIGMADILAFHRCFIFISLKTFKLRISYYSFQYTTGRKQACLSTLVYFPMPWWKPLNKLVHPGRGMMELERKIYSCSVILPSCLSMLEVRYSHISFQMPLSH